MVFFGAGSYVLPVIQTLNRQFDLALVVTTETDPNAPVPKFCKSNNVELLSISSLSSQIINNKLSIINCRVAVLASFGIIVPDAILNLFELGILNIHPSLLPKYRGPTPVQSAILAGDKVTGVSIIKLDEQVDHGPILAQEKIDLNGTETTENLSKKLFLLGGEMVIKIVRKIEKGLKVIEKEQDHSKAIFTEHLKRESGFVDINNPPKIEQLDRMIRAYYPWPGVWFHAKLNGIERTIKLLPEQKIQVEGKNTMQLRDFANGYKEASDILSILGSASDDSNSDTLNE